LDLSESVDPFDHGVGKFLSNLGMNLVEEHIQEYVLKNHSSRYDEQSNPEAFQMIESMKKNLVYFFIFESLSLSFRYKKFSLDFQGLIKQINKHLHFKDRRCRICHFKTESQLVLQNHLESVHFEEGFALCSFCAFQSRDFRVIIKIFLVDKLKG